ncbi:sodium/proton antiporter (CPA1 family) [Knoellia remsis]|uniref:Sodium/proton antiporter (CPA1 family) n=1 Tax=Knoellia remsis TaxID=407159 RepID=A0A2T0UCM0_9MICO|nr:cation:proton antiporter [Knoellia remsis]PRY55642.1 sodium/proton antiporter (CPA1 family) [Knoellia remsis]
MSAADAAYLVLGVALFFAVIVPPLLERWKINAPIVLVTLGLLIGLIPGVGDPEVKGGFDLDPMEHETLVMHVTEFTVLVSLMGVGLALDRPLSLRNLRTWKSWSPTWRLLGIAMPLCIAGVALLAWGPFGVALPAAVLLGAALAPTDPVLASDVQVEAPSVDEVDADKNADADENTGADKHEADGAAQECEGDDGSQKPAKQHGDACIDEEDEVRFALTSEAGLNDGLAFPFVYLALMLATMGAFSEWGWRWVAWELVGKVVLGVGAGLLVGWAVARLAFTARNSQIRYAATGQPLVAIGALLTSYGLAEVIGGYGFLAVFTAAVAIRSFERSHSYHHDMHAVIERLERLLTLVVLLLLGASMTNGLLANLDLAGVVVSLALLLVIRPLAGMVAFLGHRSQRGVYGLGWRERVVTSFYGVRGVGSLFYLSYALTEAEFAEARWIWSVVGLTIVLSVYLHGLTAPWAMQWQEQGEQAQRRAKVRAAGD